MPGTRDRDRHIYFLLFHNLPHRGLSKQNLSLVPRVMCKNIHSSKPLETNKEREQINVPLHTMEHYLQPHSPLMEAVREMSQFTP